MWREHSCLPRRHSWRRLAGEKRALESSSSSSQASAPCARQTKTMVCPTMPASQAVPAWHENNLQQPAQFLAVPRVDPRRGHHHHAQDQERKDTAERVEFPQIVQEQLADTQEKQREAREPERPF